MCQFKKKIKNYINRIKIHGGVAVLPLFLYLVLKLQELFEEPTQSWYIYIEAFMFYFLLVFSILTYFLFQFEKIADYNNKKIGILKFIGSTLFIVLILSVTFSSYYFCIYHYDNNSFTSVNGNDIFEIYANFLFYSLGVFLMNGNSSIEANSLYAKLFTATEMLSTFIVLVLIFANYTALIDNSNKDIERI